MSFGKISSEMGMRLHATPYTNWQVLLKLMGKDGVREHNTAPTIEKDS